MATNERGHTVPPATGESPSRAAIFGTFDTINDVMLAADSTDRASKVAALSYTPSAARPALFWMEDSQTLVVSFDAGVTWQTFAAQTPRTAYTPALTGMTIGDGTVTGAYARVGALVAYEFRIQIGSTTSISAPVQVSVPVAAPTADSLAGSGVAVGIGSLSTEVMTVRGASTSTVYMYLGSTGGAVGAGTAITVGDTIRIAGTYIVA